MPDKLDCFTRIVLGHYLVFVTVYTELPQTGRANYFLDLGTTAPDCSAFDELEVPHDLSSYTCTHDGSPAFVTAL